MLRVVILPRRICRWRFASSVGFDEEAIEKKLDQSVGNLLPGRFFLIADPVTSRKDVKAERLFVSLAEADAIRDGRIE